MTRLYLVLAILGAALPLSAFAAFLTRHGADPVRFAEQLFASPISTFFALDVIVSALVVLAFVFVEGRRVELPSPWPFVAATLLVGVSFGLPLFLLARECRLAAERATAGA